MKGEYDEEYTCIDPEDGYEPREEDAEDIDSRINQIIEERNGL